MHSGYWLSDSVTCIHPTSGPSVQNKGVNFKYSIFLLRIQSQSSFKGYLLCSYHFRHRGISPSADTTEYQERYTSAANSVRLGLISLVIRLEKEVRLSRRPIHDSSSIETDSGACASSLLHLSYPFPGISIVKDAHHSLQDWI